MQSTWAGIFNLKRISAVDSKIHGIAGYEGCKLSHFNLMKELINREEPYQIVLEDDVYPTPAFKSIWPKLLLFLNSNRNDWDFIGLDPFVHFEKPSLEVFTPELFKVSAFRNMGGLIYRTAFIKEKLDSILSIESVDYPIDMTFTHSDKFIKLTPQYLIMRQRVDKISQISGNLYVACCNQYYDNTELYFEEARKRLGGAYRVELNRSSARLSRRGIHRSPTHIHRFAAIRILCRQYRAYSRRSGPSRIRRAPTTDKQSFSIAITSSSCVAASSRPSDIDAHSASVADSAEML